ncbi:MAG: TlyA family RNA methyltransferase [Bdellovibrionota bacterium]|nr:MAG: TlyA family RNA methyltransferase [Bdellovibrionota bacterium]
MAAKKKSRIRLDDLLIERGLAKDRAHAVALLLAGEVCVTGHESPKAGTLVPTDVELKHSSPQPFVSRAGTKLSHALDHFKVEVAGRVCADVGAATGGFSDVLLKRGAKKVFAIDVGYGDLAWSVRSDPRLVPIERTNARYLDALPEPPDLIVVDVSFISLALIIPSIRRWIDRRPADLLLLIKPQFEAAPDEVGSGGVVADPAVHTRVIEEVRQALFHSEFIDRGVIDSPIRGMTGNKEFLVYATTKLPS